MRKLLFLLSLLFLISCEEKQLRIYKVELITGEVYTVKNKDGSETRYFPVYNQIDDEYEIIGFEVR